MADVREATSESPNKTILRLKRKRNEDPADLLLVCHAFKKFITQEGQLQAAAESKNDSVQRIFRLAGTVSKSDDNLLSPEVLTRLKYGRHKSKVKVKLQNDIILESINQKLREIKKLSSQKSRYKVISKHRKDKENPSELPENNAVDADATAEEISKLYQLYDIALDETELAEAKVEKESGKNDEVNGKNDDDPNAILCNSVKMIREKLNIDNGPTKHSDLQKDYVYDVYCADDNYGVLSDVLDIVRVNESQLVSEIEEDLEYYDDDDDSNDENNWRNDYPDEDDWGEGSEEESRYRSENFDYGWEGETADRYGDEYGRRMFSDNLSSDEDHAYFGEKYGEHGNDKNEYNFEIVDEENSEIRESSIATGHMETGDLTPRQQEI